MPMNFLVSVSKAQHGCIDCLALMICAELQALKSFKDSSEKSSIIGKTKYSGWRLIVPCMCFLLLIGYV